MSPSTRCRSPIRERPYRRLIFWSDRREDIDRTDLRRAPGNRAGKPRAPSTVGRADANREASAAPLDGPTVLDPPRQGLQDWRSALIGVPPDTVLRWHRQWLRRRWHLASRR